jgi:hypothetical protein
MKKQIEIVKASGESSIFSEGKLRNSLHRAGASADQINIIIDDIYTRLYKGISTKEIYQQAFKMLKGSARHTAAKYQLKKAIMELGPSGFPFERFVAEIFRQQGYTVSIGEIIDGQCVKHEVDVIASINQTQLLIECKYHNLQGIICDVKIPLYIHSRFKDVEATWIKENGGANKQYRGCVVTNTRFSDDAMQYGNCAGLKLIGWSYPQTGSLKDQIDELGLYPITCLTSITKSEKQYLLEKNIVLCNEIINNKKTLENAGIRAKRLEIVIDEAYQLCHHKVNNNS